VNSVEIILTWTLPVTFRITNMGMKASVCKGVNGLFEPKAQVALALVKVRELASGSTGGRVQPIAPPGRIAKRT
jgi:hypothetical protein